VTLTSRELSGQDLAKFYSEVNGIIRTLVQSVDSDDKLCGVLIIDNLIGIEDEDNTAQETRFANYLRQLFPSDVPIMIVAARALGKLAQQGGTYTADFVEFELKRAIEWLAGEILRATHQREGWYMRTNQEAQLGLRLASPDGIHGSLLIIKELLLHGGMFMSERFMETCDKVLRLRDHPDALVRRTVISLIPELAAYSPDDFVKHYLPIAMGHLLGQIHSEKERGSSKESDRANAFLAIGRLALVAKQGIEPYLDDVIHGIKECLRAKSKNRSSLDAPIFQCIGMLANAVGLALIRYMPGLLDLIFATGLNEAMSQTLADLAMCIPILLPVIQENLLNTISLILASEPYRAPGAPPVKRTPSSRRDTQEAKSVDTMILALTTLGSFNFSGHVLNEFVRDTCIVYLDHDNPKMRKAAAQTCCRLFARDPILFQTSEHASQVVGEVLDKLLLVGIADPDLRKILIQQLAEIEYSSVGRTKEESARLLALLIAASERLIRPYTETVLKTLIPNIKDPSPGVVSCVLQALGEVARIGSEDLLPYMDQLMPMFIEILQDQSSPTKRSSALTALSRLASNTGYVIDPYLKHPVLLDILIGILKTEQSVRIRQETMKLVGVLGALDPYKHKQMVNVSGDQKQTEKSDNSDVALLMSGIDPSADEYYPTVVINALLKILKDPSLSQQYQPATQAILNIFQALQLKMVPFLPQIMPVYLSIMQSGTLLNLDFYFEKMAFLVQIVKLHIRPYIPELMKLINDNWNHARLQERIIGLIESMIISLEGEFKTYMPKLFRSMLAVLDTDATESHGPSFRVLQALVKLGPSIEDYLHLIIPQLVKTLERTDIPMNLRRAAISTIGALSKRLDFSDYASRIILPLTRVLSVPGAELKTTTMDVLCLMALRLGNDYINFIPLVLNREKASHANYSLVESKLLNRGQLPLPSELTGMGEDRYVVTTDVPQAVSDNRKLPVNPMSLRRVWDTQSRSTKEDWADWIRRLCLEMLKETPSHSLRACSDMANSFQPLARELFNSAFMSCWTSLTEQFQTELAEAIKTALQSPTISPEIIQTLLNLAEYMEHDDKPLPIEIRLLGKCALSCHAYAKALHYKELEFRSNHSTLNIESLISINNHLQQSDAAAGILTYAQQHHDIELRESWYERLHRWEDALAAYERKQLESPHDLNITVGRMRCLHALGEWEALLGLAQSKWSDAPYEFRRMMAPFAASASWGQGEWEDLNEYITVMRDQAPDKAFFKAILYLHRNQIQEAEGCIDLTRTLLDTELTALVSESYSRAYDTVVRVQMMAELEEIITYRRYKEEPHRQAIIRKTWTKRLIGCERNVEIWQRVLQVHAIALPPAEDMEMRIKFMNLCRKSGRLRLADQSMKALVGSKVADMEFSEMVQVTPPQVVYARLKYMWATGNREYTLQCLKLFTNKLASDLGHEGNAQSNGSVTAGSDHLHGPNEALSKLLARCYLKQGEWRFALDDEWTRDSIELILTPYHYATCLDRNWYKAWHTWALANFDVISYYEKSQAPTGANGTKDESLQYVIPSVTGFFRSIALSAGNSLQDTLRLLTLWFKFGHRSDVSVALGKGFSTVRIDTWLQVIPQIIARIHAPSQNVHRLIHQLLTDIGKAHPQALVYSVTVASKSPSVFRKNAALAIMENMRVHCPVLVDQALMVSQELVRVVVLWHEMWEEGLREASSLNANNGQNIDAMLALLEPLHQTIMKRPETMHEVSFNKAFGRELREAYDCCTRFRHSRDVRELNHAWGIYVQVFKRIEKLPFLSTLDLPYVSPQLQNIRDLELAIPGTYKSGEPIVRISSFFPTLTVLKTKQRPRRLTIRGSDGRIYEFLLKGQEDIRQDERVMQLFGLCNTLLATDPETFKRHLGILQFVVIPLSPSSGLIGWLPDTDTLHSLINEYRESRQISMQLEHQMLTQMAPKNLCGYDNLTVLQKVEIFENMLANTDGLDLYNILWLKSRNSEVWLERRTNYTRSLAVMSMVGHILGLGDRHPSNIMMDRNTGRIVHIDFGDCFEVAMHRAQYPERIPFRLTRMLVKAMEASGYEGSFRTTSENVMRVMRENKESVMAVLEAFVYDPLINWRILHTSPRQQPVETAQPRNATKVSNESFPKDQGRSLRRPVPSEQELVSDHTDSDTQPEQLNQRALTVLNRVTNKLTGRDFSSEQLDVRSQVEKLIRQATSTENLCQCW
ncbi:phosphatidylinositol kinase- protein kinase tor1, partial [Lunasporangiospora selenospora]